MIIGLSHQQASGTNGCVIKITLLLILLAELHITGCCTNQINVVTSYK